MPHMKIVLDGDGKFPELQGKKIHRAEISAATGLPGGMASGKASVAFIIPLEDGSVVFAETSLSVFLGAARAFRGRYGEDG